MKLSVKNDSMCFLFSVVILLTCVFILVVVPILFLVLPVDKHEDKVYNKVEAKQEEQLNNEEPIYHTRIMPITAYTVGDGYTPGTVMANGEEVYVGAVACNDYPLGTIIHIEGNEYVVADRMLHDGKIDIYMDSYEACMDWGVRELEVKVYVKGDVDEDIS